MPEGGDERDMECCPVVHLPRTSCYGSGPQVLESKCSLVERLSRASRVSYKGRYLRPRLIPNTCTISPFPGPSC